MLQKHSGTCGFEPLYCENKCGMKVQRRHMGQHKLGECAKRLVACRYCNKEFVFDTLGAHHTKCGRFPVACPHRCETAVLPREDLEVHLKDHCTTHLLSCTFKDAGCRFKVRTSISLFYTPLSLSGYFKSILFQFFDFNLVSNFPFFFLILRLN